MRSALGLAWLSALALGCVSDDPATDVNDQELRPPTCSTCDQNGLNPEAWKIAPAVFSPTALSGIGLITGGAVKPICAPGTITTGAGGARTCTLDPAWANFATIGPTLEQNYRTYLLLYIVKVGARLGDTVNAPTLHLTLSGAFALAPTIFGTPWNYQTQSIITGGMAVLTDAVANGVDLCLKTEFTPDCPGSYHFHEIAGSGNLFAGQPELVVGGYDAEDPTDSSRVCSGSGPCNTYSNTAPYHAAKCVYTGPTLQRTPTACSIGPGSPVYDFPVQVFTPFDPSTFGTTGQTGVRL